AHRSESPPSWSRRRTPRGRARPWPRRPQSKSWAESRAGTVAAANKTSGNAARGFTIAPTMEAALTPAEQANVKARPSETGKAVPHAITLTFSLEEADALNRWLLRPAQDGALAADDATVRPGLMKIR